MQKSLQNFTTALIDYAGLFPPAKLPIDTAITKYIQYLSEADAWMMSRFIIPAGRLDELRPYSDLFAQNPPIKFSILGRGGDDKASFLSNLKEDVAKILTFQDQHHQNVAGDMMEIRFPNRLLAPRPSKLAIEVKIANFLLEATEIITSAGGKMEGIFLEPARTESWRYDVAVLAEAIAIHNKTGKIKIGFKLRCGGVESHMFPSVEEVAAAIRSCNEYQIPFKGTAGLHHPIRHFNKSVNTKMYGFFNIFGAALLMSKFNLSDAELTAIILEEDISQFVFDGETFKWKNYQLSANEITFARQNLALSYGSCSFDDPREDLVAAGLK